MALHPGATSNIRLILASRSQHIKFTWKEGCPCSWHRHDFFMAAAFEPSEKGCLPRVLNQGTPKTENHWVTTVAAHFSLSYDALPQGFSDTTLLASGAGLCFVTASCPVSCRMLSSFPGLYPLDASDNQISRHIANSFPWRAESPPIENSCPEQKWVSMVLFLTRIAPYPRTSVSQRWPQFSVMPLISLGLSPQWPTSTTCCLHIHILLSESPPPNFLLSTSSSPFKHPSPPFHQGAQDSEIQRMPSGTLIADTHPLLLLSDPLATNGPHGFTCIWFVISKVSTLQKPLVNNICYI